MYLLDTDHLGILQRQTEPVYSRLSGRIGIHPPGSFYVAIISFHEQVMGWNAFLNRARTSRDVARGYHKLNQILTDFSTAQVLPFDLRAAAVFDSLRDQRIRVGTMDLRIAAIAITRDLTVLTRNLSDFRRVPRLKVEDWTI